MKDYLFIAACILLSIGGLAQTHQANVGHTLTLRLDRPSAISFSPPVAHIDKTRTDPFQSNSVNNFNTSPDMRPSTSKGYHISKLPLPENGNSKENGKREAIEILTYSRE